MHDVLIFSFVYMNHEIWLFSFLVNFMLMHILMQFGKNIEQHHLPCGVNSGQFVVPLDIICPEKFSPWDLNIQPVLLL